jgi:hypothetical protein
MSESVSMGREQGSGPSKKQEMSGNSSGPGVGRTTRTQETGRGSRKVLVHERESPTLQQVWESFLFDWTGANAQGKKDYQNLLWNQVMPHFGAKTPVD